MFLREFLSWNIFQKIWRVDARVLFDGIFFGVFPANVPLRIMVTGSCAGRQFRWIPGEDRRRMLWFHGSKLLPNYSDNYSNRFPTHKARNLLLRAKIIDTSNVLRERFLVFFGAPGGFFKAWFERTTISFLIHSNQKRNLEANQIMGLRLLLCAWSRFIYSNSEWKFRINRILRSDRRFSFATALGGCCFWI